MLEPNDRTARLIAQRAGEELCTQLSQNHERLLMTPSIYLDPHANPNCTEVALQRAESLRMQRQLPEVPSRRLEAGDDDLGEFRWAVNEPKTPNPMDGVAVGSHGHECSCGSGSRAFRVFVPSLMKAQEAN